MAMYLGEDKVASLGSICNVLGNASKNLFDAYKYSENETHTGNVSKYSIINPNEIEISYINGWSRLVLTLTGLEPNTDYTISAYLDKSNFSTSVGSGFYALDNYQDNAFIKGSGNVYFTFTSSSTGTFDMWFYGNWSGTNYSGSIIYQNIQLEKGSTATEYEEYYEPIISVKDSNGDYHEVPYVTGKASKNLYDKKTVHIEGASNQNASNEIPVLPNTTYTFSIGKYTWGEVQEFNNSGTQTNKFGGSENDKIITFTTSSNAKYIRTTFYTGTNNVSLNEIDFTQIQLEKGSTATEYEEYYEPTISIRTSDGTFREVNLDVQDLSSYVTAGSNITINYVEVRKFGKVVSIVASITPTASIEPYAIILNGFPNHNRSAYTIACNVTDNATAGGVYLYANMLQTRASMASGKNYRFTLTYIVD